MTESCVTLTDLTEGETGKIDHLSLPEEDQQFLMRIGFVPGTEVRFCRSAPLGDPKVYMIDGTQIALRAETAARIFVSRSTHPGRGL
ncbi:MAG TPA: FeoA family protein [Terriglobales bacterium]|nr:FeoA family protein [Terriglobales bacterium]